jgi:hypothetical protein
MIMYSSDYAWDVDEQAIARLHRSGQKNPVNVYRLIATAPEFETMDQIILDAIKAKNVNIVSLYRQAREINAN